MEIRRRSAAPDPLLIEIDSRHEAELRWFYTSPDPEAEDEERYVRVRRCFSAWYGEFERERDAYAKTAAKKHGNLHGADPLARFFNPGQWAGKHPMTAVAMLQSEATEAYELYREAHPPPAGGAALQEWTARHRNGGGLRDWLLAIEAHVIANDAAARDRELYEKLLRKAAGAVRKTYLDYATRAAEYAQGEDE